VSISCFANTLIGDSLVSLHFISTDIGSISLCYWPYGNTDWAHVKCREMFGKWPDLVSGNPGDRAGI